jgi:cellulose synthase/poly-beta-1,6-N-acetylglucosamine synthase-like glycosyltransferase
MFYLLLLILVYYGLRRLRDFGSHNEQAEISIVIAARNEADRIVPCLQSLEALHYPKDKLEIILVDDCSEDDTISRMREYVNKHSHWKIIGIDTKSDMLQGKKNALLKGISKAKGEIIFTTDADCQVPPNWLSGMSKMFAPGVSMVLGYSPLIKQNGFCQKLLRFDNLFSAIASAAPTKLGYPFTSVGRNMAYRKEAYENAGGFFALKKFKSGDDLHLTERFRYLNNGTIEFCANPEAFVATAAPKGFNEILHQQIRKNSKTLLATPTSVIMSLLIFSFYLLLFLIPVLYPYWLKYWLLLVGVKLLAEYFPLSLANRIFKQGFRTIEILTFQLIYPFHIILFSLIGLFQVYKWKK